MSRALIFGLLVVLAPACHKDPDIEPQHPKSGDLPPLPPASGTPIGYLLDAQTQLALTPDQLTQLKQLDASLAAQNDSIDTQIRAIEKPEPDEPQDPKAPPKRTNHAPGKETHTTADSQKLHLMHMANDREALKKVFAILDPKQQESATRILSERGVELPGAKKSTKPDTEDGTPLPETLPGPGEP
jgi:hypothetical protein